MHRVETDSSSHFVVSLGSEEALILLQPQRMLRRTLDGNPAWAADTRFLTLTKGRPGMLVVLPKAVTAALLAADDGHPLERELKGVVFDLLHSGERPALGVTK